MKKIFSLLLVVVLLTGCGKDKKMASPSDKVKAYMDSYINLDDNVLDSIDEMIDDMNEYTSKQKDLYRDLMKRHYKNIDYEIKDETIDDDQAVVEVEIEVYDYTLVLNDEYNQDDFLDENDEYSLELFNDYQLDLLKNVTGKTKYTIIFNLSKQDDEWVIKEPNDITMQKIHGIYNY